jgi:hypothetical protein
MRNSLITATVIVAVTALTGVAHAGDSQGFEEYCKGSLTQFKNHRIGVLHNNEPNPVLCLVKKSEQNKVLAACSLGHYCKIEGRWDFCDDGFSGTSSSGVYKWKEGGPGCVVALTVSSADPDPNHPSRPDPHVEGF